MCALRLFLFAGDCFMPGLACKWLLYAIYLIYACSFLQVVSLCFFLLKDVCFMLVPAHMWLLYACSCFHLRFMLVLADRCFAFYLFLKTDLIELCIFFISEIS
jgi:hypothetical protein